MDYIYNNALISPNFDNLKTTIVNSAMLEKSLLYLLWDEDLQIIRVVFTNVLSESDKTVLDSIIIPIL